MNSINFKQIDKKQKTSITKRRFFLIVSLAIVFSIILMLFLEVYRSNMVITSTCYTLESNDIDTPLRIVQITDLHSKSFGANNEDLILATKKEKPDILVLTGDIVDRYTEEEIQTEYLESLLSELTDIAPVYASIGNHEQASIKEEKYREILEKNGCVFLDNEYCDVSINNTKLRIGGLSYYRRWDEEKNALMKEFSQSDSFTLLLCHFPEYYLWGVEDYPIDLTLSGHTHGGLIRFPFAGGAYAPEQGWFPEYDKGCFEEANGTLIISSGLASSPVYVPRFLNPCEITVVDIK